MAIEIKLLKDDEYKTYKRPDTTLLDLDEFEEFQNELGKMYEKYVKEVTDYEQDLKAYKKGESDVEPKAISFYPYKKEMRERQIEYIVELFEDHDPFTVNEFKLGMPSKKFDDVIVDVFKQISPADFQKSDDEGKSKNSRMSSSRRT